jgi:Uma2 family endonuclease
MSTAITVEQFMNLNLPQGREWELHNGEIVDMGEPSPKRRRIQRQIFLILARLFPNADVLFEYGFRIGSNVRSADVGVADKARLSDDLLEGAPELVVEVLSPSNIVKGLKEYRNLCFANGTRVFLTVDADDRTVQVNVNDVKDGRTLVAGEQITLELFGQTVTLAIADIFNQLSNS